MWQDVNRTVQKMSILYKKCKMNLKAYKSVFEFARRTASASEIWNYDRNPPKTDLCTRGRTSERISKNWRHSMLIESDSRRNCSHVRSQIRPQAGRRRSRWYNIRTQSTGDVPAKCNSCTLLYACIIQEHIQENPNFPTKKRKCSYDSRLRCIFWRFQR